MESSKLNGADYLLILFCLPNGNCTPIEGKTRITKMMFLFNKEVYPRLGLSNLTPEERLPKFEPYNYGPFSRDVHEQLYLFCNIGFLSVKEKPLDRADYDEGDLSEDVIGIDEEDDQLVSDSPTVEQYCLTQLGEKFVREKLLPLLDPEQIEALSVYKERITRMRLRDILSYVYRKYPDSTVNSLIKDRVLRNV